MILPNINGKIIQSCFKPPDQTLLLTTQQDEESSIWEAMSHMSENDTAQRWSGRLVVLGSSRVYAIPLIYPLVIQHGYGSHGTRLDDVYYIYIYWYLTIYLLDIGAFPWLPEITREQSLSWQSNSQLSQLKNAQEAKKL